MALIEKRRMGFRPFSVENLISSVIFRHGSPSSDLLRNSEKESPFFLIPGKPT